MWACTAFYDTGENPDSCVNHLAKQRCLTGMYPKWDMHPEKMPVVLMHRLCFVGFKLDTKGCEALEEVFRRVRTRTLDVENTNLEDDVRWTLGCMLGNCGQTLL